MDDNKQPAVTEPSPEQVELKDKAGRIETILLEATESSPGGHALSPFLDFSEQAIRPNVRLIKRPVPTE